MEVLGKLFNYNSMELIKKTNYYKLLIKYYDC